MPPGFGVDTVFGDQLLIYLSGIVRHEVNLYWGSAIHASSRHELFTAGLLPKRIPGEIYRRLALLGYGLDSRSNRVGDTTYLEMYAPLRMPGAAPATTGCSSPCRCSPSRRRGRASSRSSAARGCW